MIIPAEKPTTSHSSEKNDFLCILFIIFFIYKMNPELHDYIDFIIGNGWFNRLTTSKCRIVGGFVNKCLIRGECDDIADIDVVCGTHTQRKGKQMAFWKFRSCKARRWHNFKWTDYHGNTTSDDSIHYNWKHLTCRQNNNDVPIHLMSESQFADEIEYSGQTFINSLQFTDKGIEDIDGNDNVKDFVISNLKKGRYCKWRKMRPKDKEYFKDFEEINPNECESYGFLYIPAEKPTTSHSSEKN